MNRITKTMNIEFSFFILPILSILLKSVFICVHLWLKILSVFSVPSVVEFPKPKPLPRI